MKNLKNVSLFLLVTVFLFFVIEVTGSAEESAPEKKPHLVPAVTSTIKIDGILEEKAWEDALVMELDNQVTLPMEGKDSKREMNVKPVKKTEVLLAYDAAHLYAAFRAYDPEPEKIRANQNERDNIWKDDYVGITLDIFNDSQRAYNFYSTSKGIQADDMLELNNYISWDGTWNSAGKINDKGYIVEMAVPFSILPLKGKKEQVWGIDAVRICFSPQKEHIINLFPRDDSNKCYICQADKIILFKGE
jgi:hypothetical protein